MMVAGGIIAGVLLIFVEIAYKRHRGLKEKELELAKTAADRWRGNIEVLPGRIPDKPSILCQSFQTYYSVLHVYDSLSFIIYVRYSKSV